MNNPLRKLVFLSLSKVLLLETLLLSLSSVFIRTGREKAEGVPLCEEEEEEAPAGLKMLMMMIV